VVREKGELPLIASDDRTADKRPIRGFEVEDSAMISLSVANGTLGSFILSDTAASDRSYFVSAYDGLQNLRVIDAILQAARTGRIIEVV
jgi:predicted dehydrogenase